MGASPTPTLSGIWMNMIRTYVFWGVVKSSACLFLVDVLQDVEGSGTKVDTRDELEDDMIPEVWDSSLISASHRTLLFYIYDMCCSMKYKNVCWTPVPHTLRPCISMVIHDYLYNNRWKWVHIPHIHDIHSTVPRRER